jgi:hypothetical protein
LFHETGIVFVGDKVAPCGLALYHHSMAAAFPADSVGSFTAGATLLRKLHARTVAAQPGDGFLYKLGMSHISRFARDSELEK